MKRRDFVRNTGLLTAGLSILPQLSFTPSLNNNLPDNWVWLNGSNRVSKDKWKLLLERLQKGGFNGIACSGSEGICFFCN